MSASIGWRAQLSRRGLEAALWVLAAACGGSESPPPPPPVPVFTAQAGFPRVAGEVIEWHLARYPVHATYIGEHAFDAHLPSVFAPDLERATHDARAYLTRLTSVNRPTLERDDYLDYRVLEYGLRAELLDLEEVRGWQRDPMRYAELIDDGLLSVATATDLPAEGRVQAATGRLRELPLLLRAARQNLTGASVPPLFVAHALEEARAGAAWLRGYADPNSTTTSAATREAFASAHRAAIASVDSFVVWLERDLAPTARGDFRLGTDRLTQLLLYRHHVDLPLDEIDALNRQAIADYREWMQRVAMDLDPLRQPQAVIESLLQTHPAELRLDAVPNLTASRPRRAFQTAGPAFAISHFADLAAIESEAVSDADRLLAIRRALHAHALLHAMLRLHAGDATIDQAASDISGIALIPLQSARAEAERLAHDPGYGLVALERMQLFALRELIRARRPTYSTENFVSALSALGLPTALAAEALLEREPGRLLVVGRHTVGVPAPPSVLD